MCMAVAWGLSFGNVGSLGRGAIGLSIGGPIGPLNPQGCLHPEATSLRHRAIRGKRSATPDYDACCDECLHSKTCSGVTDTGQTLQGVFAHPCGNVAKLRIAQARICFGKWNKIICLPDRKGEISIKICPSPMARLCIDHHPINRGDRASISTMPLYVQPHSGFGGS